MVLPGKKMNATKENKLPFDITVYDDENQTVTNPFTKQSAILTPIQVAVYESIKGSELTLHKNQEWKLEIEDDELKQTIRKGIDWFRSKYPDIYYILLD